MNKISDVALSLVISGVTTVLYACAYNITAPAIGNARHARSTGIFADRVSFSLHWWAYNPSTNRDGHRAQVFHIERVDFERYYHQIDEDAAFRLNPGLQNLPEVA